MFFPGDIEKKQQIYKNGDQYIQNIPAQISRMKLERNMKYAENAFTKIIPQALTNNSIKYSSEVLHIEQNQTQPLVLLCVNMVQNREVIIITVQNTTEINKHICPGVLPESQSNIYQLLQNIGIMFKRNNQLLPQQAITRGNSIYQNNCQNSLNISELPSTLASICERNARTRYDEVRTNNINTKFLEASEKLSRPISSEYEMTRCFHIYNEIFTEFLKTFAVMYCTLTNMFLMKHKNMPCLCSHNWYFRNLTQGYVLKCVLKNEQINALNVMKEFYYIIITKCTSSTKIDIFFKFQDGILTVHKDSQECRFTRHILFNKEHVKEIECMLSLHTRNTKCHVSNNELVCVQSESDECSDLSTPVSSSLSLPEYPSQSTFFEEELNTWQQSIGEPENRRRNKDGNFEYPDSKHDRNDIYVNIWCGIQELTDSLRNLSHSTHEIVYKHISCTTGVLSTFDIFNEELFEITTFDNVFRHNSKYFKWESICKPLLGTLANTLFSYVL